MHHKSISLLLALTVTAASGLSAASSSTSGKSAGSTDSKPTIMVYPVEAIKSAMTMDANTFHETYEGINVSITGLTDEGFYVRYEHQSLVYYFGPIKNIGEGVKWRNDMELLRTRLIEKRPELESSVVYLIKIDPAFDYDSGTGAAPLSGVKR